MIEFQEYNESIVDGGIDKIQVAFKYSTKGKPKQVRKRFNSELAACLSEIRSSIMSKRVKKVVPMPKDDFDGLKHGDWFEYDTVAVKGFPYRIGVITYKVVDTKFFKIGVMVETYKHE